MKIKLISGAILCVITGILFSASIMWKNKLFSDNLPFYWLGSFILFLFAYELMTIMITHKKTSTVAPRQIISLYLLLKGGKITAILVFLMIYILVIQIETKRFILVAVTVYLIYLLFDTFYLASSEKKSKNEDL